MGGAPMLREIGRVHSVNPARRELRIVARPGFASAFAGRSELEFGLSGGRKKFAVETVEEQDRYVKVTLAEGVSADEVAVLKGANALADLKPTRPDSPFAMAAEEFKGFAVRGPDGGDIGVVAGGFNTPAHGVIEIARPGGATVLAPFVPEVVAGVDLDARVIELRDVEAHMVEQDGDGTMA